jgi:aminopeptidase
MNATLAEPPASTTPAELPPHLQIPRSFPEFSLTRLLGTVFNPIKGLRIAFLIDLDNTADMENFRFLRNPELSVQRYAYNIFYRGLHEGGMEELGLSGGEMFAYKVTGGSNLDLPDTCVDVHGKEHLLADAVYTKYDLVLCITTFSATAPITAHAKKYGFRGSTMHGLNETILRTGLSVDYNMVSANAEKLRKQLTRADWVEIDFEIEGKVYTLRLDLEGQEAQKSHGLCHGTQPDIANLPAGEVYFVPRGANGYFPRHFEDGTIGLLRVEKGRVVEFKLLKGRQETIDEYEELVRTDPVTGEIGELGFGTQLLPVSGRDIQDEKILGTIHVATGRSDHLGGHLTPDLFAESKHATHDDILFAPHKTPEINVKEARMKRGDQHEVILRDYVPTEYFGGVLRA